MSKDRSSLNRPVWLAIILIVAVLIASGTAFLFRAVGATPSEMITGSGAAFLAAVTLGMAMSTFLTT